MYLSKLLLDYWQTRNPYNIHSCLWSLFPNLKREIDWLSALDDLSISISLESTFANANKKEGNQIKRPFLFRVEKEATKESPAQILLQSEIEPVQSSFSGLKLIISKAFDLNLKENQKLRFALCANPVKFSGKTKGHVPLSREDEQINWLERKLGNSAQLLEVHVKTAKNIYFKKKLPEGSLLGKIFLVNFIGVLSVKDPILMKKTVTSGVGRGKAFGGGLLTLAKYS